MIRYSILHLECHLISISNLNLLGLFSTERGKRDLENWIVDWDLRLKKCHSKCERLYVVYEWWYVCRSIGMMHVRVYSNDVQKRIFSLLHLGCHTSVKLQSQSHWSLFNGTWQKISVQLVSFQRNVAKDLNLIGFFSTEGGKRSQSHWSLFQGTWQKISIPLASFQRKVAKDLSPIGLFFKEGGKRSQSHWSLFKGTWQKRCRDLGHRLGLEIEEMTLQMQ